MITAMFLMIALVVGMGAMTYARYTTTQDTGNQSATAAKWGIVLTVNTTNLFDKNYNDGTAVTADNTTGDVVTTADNMIVAPGTSGSMTIEINGSAEVLSQLKIAEEGTTEEIFFNDYYPVKWTLTEKNGDSAADTVDINGDSTETSGTLNDLITYLTNLKTKFNANDTIAKTYTITWNWPLGESENENNKYDTAIGAIVSGTTLDTNGDDTATNLEYVNYVVGEEILTDGMVDGTNYNCTISFQLKVTVEQIQD